MRNHTKVEKEKGKCRSEAGGGGKPGHEKKKIRKSSSSGGISSRVANREHTNEPEMILPNDETAASNRECIFLDAGSKKSYMDLTLAKNDIEQYPRISVIRNVLSTPANYEGCHFSECYQEKPVDFSPKNKYKSECSANSNVMDISRNYATMVV